MPGRNPPAVVDLPGHVMAAADLLSDADDRIAVFVERALIAPAAGRRDDAIADEFLPESHGRGVYEMTRYPINKLPRYRWEDHGD